MQRPPQPIQRPKAAPAQARVEPTPTEVLGGGDMDDGAESVSSLVVGHRMQYSMINQFRPVIDSPLNALHIGWYPNLALALDGFEDWNVRMNVIVGLSLIHI